LRYSRRRGPAANYDCTAAFTLIPGLTISRYWDEGEILICTRAAIFNNAGGAGLFSISPYLDGVAILPAPPLFNIPNASNANISATLLQALTQGPHTLALYVLGLAPPGDIVLAQNAELIVIQLGVWDSDRDIITL